MSNSKTFDDRFNAWKNGANYWKDIRGIDLYGNTQSQPESQPDMTHEEMQVLNRQANSIINEYTNKYDNGKDGYTLPEVTVTTDYPHRDRVYNIADNSNSNFVSRLKDENRKTIPNWEEDGQISTHKMGYADNVAFPMIQEQNGELYDYTNPKYNKNWKDAYDNAVKNGDAIKFETEGDARYFTEHYKTHYKGFDKYDNGKDNQQPDIPSRRLRKYISSQEGSDFVGQNRKFHGDAVGAKYKEVRNTVGNDIWNKLPQNSKEALTSYYYNIKPSSFKPTANALRKWHQTGDDNEMYKVRDSINIGLNQKGMRGLRSRRIDERGWLMEGFKPKSKTLKQVEGLQNDIQNQIMPRQPQQISTMPLDTPYKQPMTSQFILPPIVDMLGAIQNDQQLPLQLFNR